MVTIIRKRLGVWAVYSWDYDTVLQAEGNDIVSAKTAAQLLVNKPINWGDSWFIGDTLILEGFQCQDTQRKDLRPSV